MSNGILNAVVDLSHHNENVDFAAAKKDGILGVVHKATQGLTFKDCSYAERKPLAVQSGLFWGAYHFGIDGDGTAQAKYFLDFVKPDSNVLLVLDFEKNTQGGTMTLKQAEDFAIYVNGQTNRWPGLYTGYSFIKDSVPGADKSDVLAKCLLWLAKYSNSIIVPKPWTNWTLWQYTDGNIGPAPHAVKGIGNCDRDKFNGDGDALKKLWLNN
jgi:lysozyme